MQVFFSHGKESGPWGTKIKRLAALAQVRGLSVDSVDYRGMDDPEARVRKLVDAVQASGAERYIRAGSSLGGYVSVAAAEALQPAGLFLLAPAVCLPDYPDSDRDPGCENVEVVHAWDDEIIPVDCVIRFGRQTGCRLHLITGGHRLLGPALDTVAELFESYLGRLQP